MADSSNLPIGWEIIENPPHGQWPDKAAASVAWEQLKQQLPIGTILTGNVFLRTPFGVFFDAGLGFPALMEITNFDSPEPPFLGCTISGRVADFTDHNWQVRVIKLSESYG